LADFRIGGKRKKREQWVGKHEFSLSFEEMTGSRQTRGGKKEKKALRERGGGGKTPEAIVLWRREDCEKDA